MKILTQVARIYKGKEYHKAWIIIPINMLKELGWKKGDELAPEIKDKNTLIVTKKS